MNLSSQWSLLNGYCEWLWLRSPDRVPSNRDGRVLRASRAAIQLASPILSGDTGLPGRDHEPAQRLNFIQVHHGGQKTGEEPDGDLPKP